jgi:hypothetical protein
MPGVVAGGELCADTLVATNPVAAQIAQVTRVPKPRLDCMGSSLGY